MAGRPIDSIFSLRDLLAKLSPMDPGHPLNPLNVFGLKRIPPCGDLDSDHRSLLLGRLGSPATQQLYGVDVGIEDVPFPNMEWWWNAIDFSARADGSGELASFSCLSNVHLFAIPIVGWVVQSTLAIRKIRITPNSKTPLAERVWQVHTTARPFPATAAYGRFYPDSSARFEGPAGVGQRWSMHLEAAGNRAAYHIDVDCEGVAAQLVIDYDEVVLFGDNGLPKGWYDNNPRGFFPNWATYRSRFGRPRGYLRLQVEGRSERYDVIANGAEHARFDHQSLHASINDLRKAPLPALAEALSIRPQWVWYHARLSNGLNLVAYEIRNGYTSQVLKRAAAICPDRGPATTVDEAAVNFQQPMGSRPGTLELKTRAGDRLILQFDIANDPGWTVVYPVVGPFAYRGQEACGTLSGRHIPAGGAPVSISGTATREVLDLVTSVKVL